MSVPFETTDIHFKRSISLTLSDIYAKVVDRRRGGFCYELNYLFSELLRYLGFSVALVSARVYSKGAPGPRFDHLALIVELEDSYLVDVGFGDLFYEPLRLNEQVVQTDGNKDYLIERLPSGDYHVLSSLRGEGRFKPKYVFDLRGRRIEEFQRACAFKQSSPDSHFVRHFICTIPTEVGRKTIRDNTYTERRNGTTSERSIGSKKELLQLLAEEFGLREAPGSTIRLNAYLTCYDQD